MENYYTYAYLREDKTPYYIGKGKCKTQRHLHPGHYVPIPPEERILILKNNISEDEAIKHEIYLISLFGRKDNNTGILRNLTEGAEGGRFQYNQRHGRPLITPEVSQRASETETLGGGTYERGPKRLPKSKRKYDRQVLSGVRAASEQEKQRARKRMGIKEDIYDIILSHLLDEGYADTQEAAEAIMVNMSEEWRESILG